jgi:GAG-pre-integrase domain
MTLLTDDKSNVGHAAFHNGLFQVQIKPLPKSNNPFKSREVLTAAIDFNDPVWRMHRRLGHLSFQGMLNLKKVSTGINVTKQQIKDKLKAICPVYAITRALVRIPRDLAKRKSNELGELIHVDVWGPYPVEGYDATKLFLLMTDDYTRFT